MSRALTPSRKSAARASAPARRSSAARTSSICWRRGALPRRTLCAEHYSRRTVVLRTMPRAARAQAQAHRVQRAAARDRAIVRKRRRAAERRASRHPCQGALGPRPVGPRLGPQRSRDVANARALRPEAPARLDVSALPRRPRQRTLRAPPHARGPRPAPRRARRAGGRARHRSIAGASAARAGGASSAGGGGSHANAPTARATAAAASPERSASPSAESSAGSCQRRPRAAPQRACTKRAVAGRGGRARDPAGRRGGVRLVGGYEACTDAEVEQVLGEREKVAFRERKECPERERESEMRIMDSSWSDHGQNPRDSTRSVLYTRV